MARRIGWLSGIAALLLALLRLGRLLQPQAEGPAWEVVLAAAALLGAVFTWAAISYRLPLWAIAAVNLAGAALAAIRVAAPTTLAFGIIPTTATPAELEQELEFAFELIRFGAAPVLPVAGLIALLTLAFWGLGALLAAGMATQRPLLAAAPSLVFYLQLATLDRRPPGMGWMVAFALITATAVLAMGVNSDPRTGRVRDPDGRLLPRRSTSLPVVLAAAMVLSSVTAANAFAASVPESGVLSWRSRSGIGSGLYGGSSFNLFVGLQQSLVDLSDEPVFYARVSESAPDPDEVYWRLITLDVFDGENWIPGDIEYNRRGRGGWEREEHQFQGPTVPVAARVRIANLKEQLLPVIYSPADLETDVELIDESFRVGEDGSVGIDVRTREGWEYEIQSQLPRPDIAQLASLGGELSPIFSEAAEAGEFDVQPPPNEFSPRPEGMDYFLELPDDIPSQVGLLARELTADGVTVFEKAVLLEAWFRDPEIFTYSVDVSTGHSALDLEDWLLDPESRNYRTGYCEQFATAFAVMARFLGIPSRVVLGFTPGDVETQSDGSELIVVRERNAHAWVELWLDGQGWVRFDPTPRSDGINPSFNSSEMGFDPRAFIPAPEEPGVLGGGPLNPDAGPAGIDEEIDTGFDPLLPIPTPGGTTGGVPGWLMWLMGAAAVVSLVPLVKLVRRQRRMRRLREGDVTAAWDEIVDRLRDLGADIAAHQTPLEIARLQHPDLVPLASLYSKAVYGEQRVNDGRKAFSRAVNVLEERYQPAHRAYAWMAPTSLRRR